MKSDDRETTIYCAPVGPSLSPASAQEVHRLPHSMIYARKLQQRSRVQTMLGACAARRGRSPLQGA